MKTLGRYCTQVGETVPTLAVSAAKVGKPIISSSMADNAPPLSEQRSYTLIKDGSTSTLYLSDRDLFGLSS